MDGSTEGLDQNGPHGASTTAPPEPDRRRAKAPAWVYEHVARPLLFRLDPETAHRLSQAALAREFPWRLSRKHAARGDRLRVRVGNWQLASPIGLAAGFDKNGDAVPGLRHLGFGYLTIGSILPRPSTGHPRPRLVRNPDDLSMVNCYGLPSEGLDACATKFRSVARRDRRVPLIANIHAETIAEYEACVAALAPFADAVELALRCPNRAGHISIYPVPELDRLMALLRRRWPDLPLFLKLPPYFNDEEKANRLELVERAIDFGLGGVTIPGNWSVEDKRLSRGQGSLSGRPTFANNLAIVREMAAVTRGRIAIKATGGVHSGEDAFQLLSAGAAMIDIFTAFVFRGWNAVAAIEAELLHLMDARGVARASDMIEAAARRSG